jgi:CHASE2 domain-containing sensor protein
MKKFLLWNATVGCLFVGIWLLISGINFAHSPTELKSAFQITSAILWIAYSLFFYKKWINKK